MGCERREGGSEGCGVWGGREGFANRHTEIGCDVSISFRLTRQSCPWVKPGLGLDMNIIIH
jgi:hypothetical protein